MKNKKIILAVLFALYLVFGFTLYTKDDFSGFFGYDDYHIYNNYMEKRYMQRVLDEAKIRDYDYTCKMNADMIDVFSRFQMDLDSGIPYNLQDGLNFSFDSAFPIYKDSVRYFVTNEVDVDRFIKNYGLNNPHDIKFVKRKIPPLSDKKYKNIFKDKMPDEKIEPEILGNDKRGYTKFSSSVDALVLCTVDSDIIMYAYVDNRFFDTRNIMNMQINENNVGNKEYVLRLLENEDKSYNYYKADYAVYEYDESVELQQ